MADRETYSEARKREAEEKAAEERAKAAAKAMGGISGKGAETIMGRKKQLDEEIEKAGG